MPVTDFGYINGRRCMTFDVSWEGKVYPVKFRGREDFCDIGQMISAHEAFKRWKIARKAWVSRRRKQLLLPLWNLNPP